MPSQHGHGCRVEVVTGNGARHTMLGFDTEDEAKDWIEADKKRERFAHAGLVLDDAD